MEGAGRIVEEVLEYIKEGGIRKEDINGKFGLEEGKVERMLKFLLDLELIEMNGEKIKITASGLEFLQL